MVELGDVGREPSTVQHGVAKVRLEKLAFDVLDQFLEISGGVEVELGCDPGVACVEPFLLGWLG